VLDVNYGKDSTGPLLVSLAPCQWRFVINDANGQCACASTDHLLKTGTDTIFLTLKTGQQPRYSR
jgi:hypothetical protein